MYQVLRRLSIITWVDKRHFFFSLIIKLVIFMGFTPKVKFNFKEFVLYGFALFDKAMLE